MKFIKSIDMFGKECRFVIDQNETFKTGIGGLFSILVYLGLLTLTWNFGQDIYLRQAPKVVQQLDFLDKTPYFPINNSNYNIAINLRKDNGIIIPDPSSFTLNAYIERRQIFLDSFPPTIKTTDKQLEIVECSNKTMENKYYERDHFKAFFCPQIDNGTIGGSIEEEDDDYKIILEVKRCNSKTQNTTICMDDAEILKNHGSLISIAVKIQNNYFNARNYKEPIIKNFGQELFKVQSVGGTSYEGYLTYGAGYLIDDSGLIFEDPNEPLNYLQMQKLDFYNIGQNKDSDILFKLTVKLSRTGLSCTRSYLKIPDVLANVGGFMGLLTPIIEYLIAFYVDSEYYIYLYKHLFKFEIEKDDGMNLIQLNANNSLNLYQNNNNSRVDINKTNNTKLKSSNTSGTKFKENEMSVLSNTPNFNDPVTGNSKHDSSKLDLINNANSSNQSPDLIRKVSKIKNGFKLKEAIVNKDVKSLLNYKSRDREIITVSKCERFCVLGCCCFNKKQSDNLKYELINHAEKELEKKFDVIEVFKLFNQLRVIKKLLLNENQCFLLENRGMHTLTNSKSKPLGEIQDLDVVKFNESFRKCLEYLKSKKQEVGFSDIDLILIKYLKEEISSKINEEIQT